MIVLSPEMSLATVRAYIWKKSEDLILNYRVVQGSFVEAKEFAFVCAATFCFFDFRLKLGTLGWNFCKRPKTKSQSGDPCGQISSRPKSNGQNSTLSLPLRPTSDSVAVNGASVIKEREERRSLIDEGNERLRHKVNEEKRVKDGVLESLEPLWDDGYGTVTVKDYFDATKEMIKPDGGPPRWFCPVACGAPLKDSPILFFLPGLDGTGWGLILHHKALGKAFEVRCLHIPINDRTPFEGLVKFVEETIRLEHASSPNKPIYLVGDSFGGCLSLAVAARNPTIDLVLILVNSASSIERSQLQPLIPILDHT
ncbi:Esterase/lipase/thioesterase family protein [Prunus dulcis]|uniref:Esterase/lipase/thioesterase family protein n=1 Tax=Prunus dulcis TaxID=3755 RepID=A0A4Y1RRZ0_PRUDU|nr:Esterase/lipase/thioesterase family protein [Prunus dulcis]